MIGQSSRNIVLFKSIQLESTIRIPYVYTTDTTIGDVMKEEKGREIIAPLMQVDLFNGPEAGNSSTTDVATAAISPEMMEAMMEFMPLRGVLSFGEGKITVEDLDKIVDRLNKEI